MLSHALSAPLLNYWEAKPPCCRSGEVSLSPVPLALRLMEDLMLEERAIDRGVHEGGRVLTPSC